MADKGIIFSAPMVRALLAGRKTQTRRLLKPQVFCSVQDGGFTWGKHSGIWPDDWFGLGNAIDGDLPYAPGDRLWVRENCRAEELSRPPRSRPANRQERSLLKRTAVIECDDDDGRDGVRYLADDAWRSIENTPEAGDQWSTLYHYGTGGKRPIRAAPGGLVPCIHMPRWASRLWLAVTDVRVQRLQAISEADAIAEGVEPIIDPRGPAWKSYETCPDGTPHPHAGVPNASPVTSYRELWNTLHTKPSERWDDNPWIVAVSFDVHRGNIDA